MDGRFAPVSGRALSRKSAFVQLRAGRLRCNRHRLPVHPMRRSSGRRDQQARQTWGSTGVRHRRRHRPAWRDTWPRLACLGIEFLGRLDLSLAISVMLASTAKPSPPTRPSTMQRRTTVSNNSRSRSASRKRPRRVLEKVAWSGTSPSRPSRQTTDRPGIRFAESDAHSGCDQKKPGVELAVTRVTFGRQPHELRTPVLRIVGEFHEPLGRKPIRQPQMQPEPIGSFERWAF